MKVELANDIRSNNNETRIGSPSDLFPSKKEFTIRLRRTIAWCFGIAAEGPARDTQIRFCDAETQLALVRVPREHCDTIRSSLSLLLTRKQLFSLGEKADRQPWTSSDYYASVISVHGSARTAKIATFRKLRELYRLHLQKSRTMFPKDNNLEKKSCRGLQKRLTLIQNNLS